MKKKLTVFFILLIFMIALLLYLNLTDVLMLLLILYFIGVLIFVIYCNNTGQYFNIATLFIFLYSMYVTNIPRGFVNNKYYSYYWLANNVDIVTSTFFISGFCVVFPFITGYILKNKENKVKFLEIKISPKTRGAILLASWIFIIGGFSLFIIGIIKSGGISYLLSSYEWDNQKSSAIGILTTGFQYLVVGLILNFYIFLINETKSIFRWKCIFIVVISVLLKLLQGNRIQVIMLLIGLFSVYYYRRKKINIKWFILSIILGNMIIGTAGYFRENKTISINDISKVIEYATGQSGDMEFFLNSYTNLTTNYIIENTKVDYLYGRTIIDGFIFFIPRFIFPNKSEYLLTPKWINKYEGIQVVSPVGGLSLSAQLMMNGGVVVTIIFMFIFGIVLSNIQSKINNNYLFEISYYLISAICIISFIRNPLWISIKEVINFIIIPIIFIRCLMVLKNKKLWRIK